MSDSTKIGNVLETLAEDLEYYQNDSEDEQKKARFELAKGKALEHVKTIIHDIAEYGDILKGSEITDSEEIKYFEKIKDSIEYLKKIDLILGQSLDTDAENEHREVIRNTLRVAEKLYKTLDPTTAAMLIEAIGNDMHQISPNGRNGTPSLLDVSHFEQASKKCEELYLHVLEVLKLKKPDSEGSMDEVLPKIIDLLTKAANKQGINFSLNDGRWIGDMCYHQAVTQTVEGQAKFSTIVFGSAVEQIAKEHPDLCSKEEIYLIRKDSIDLGDFEAEMDRISNHLESIMRGARGRSNALLNAWRGVSLNEGERQELQQLKADLEQLKAGEYKNMFNKKIGAELAKEGCQKHSETLRMFEDRIDQGLGKSSKMTRTASSEPSIPSTPKRKP